MNSENTVEQLVIGYQEGRVNFDEIVGMMGGLLTVKSKEPVFGYDFDDLRQELLIELLNCCNNYNGQGKLSTMFCTYADRRIYALRQMSAHNNRKANFESDSYQLMVENGYDIEMRECGYSDIEITELLKTINLTENEEKFCKLIMSDECKNKKEIAELIGVDASSISYFRNSVRAKLQHAI